MAKATEHPSVLFSTTGRAMRLLENAGVESMSFFQRLIDDPKFRQEIVVLANPRGTYVIPDTVDPDRMMYFLRIILGIWMRDVPDDKDHAIIDRYNSVEGLRELMQPLSPREVSFLLMRSGIADGHVQSPQEVSNAHGVTANRGRQIESRALVKVREQLRILQLIAETELAGKVHILALGLSERAWLPLMRVRIETVEELTKKTEDDLLAITNFGQRSLDEVIAKLEQRGLKLKGLKVNDA